MYYKCGISEFTYIVIVIGQLCLKPSDLLRKSPYSVQIQENMDQK